MATLYRKRHGCVLQLVAVMTSLLSAVAIGIPARASDAVIETKFSCSDPEIPALFLTEPSPREDAIVASAMRSEVCRYTEQALPVTPVRFVRQVKAEPNAAEPYGYIWAFRVSGGQVAYWYFWKDEHEVMLKVSPGI